MRADCQYLIPKCGATVMAAPFCLLQGDIVKTQIFAKNEHNNTTTQHFNEKCMEYDMILTSIKLVFTYIYHYTTIVVFCCVCCVSVVFVLCFAPICCVLTFVYSSLPAIGRDIKQACKNSKHNNMQTKSGQKWG